jgi:hypothetical protein
MLDAFSGLEPNERIVVRRVPGRGVCVFVRRWVSGRGELETIVVFDDDEMRSRRASGPIAEERVRCALRKIRRLASEGRED